MITSWNIYWITRFDSLKPFFFVLGGVILIVGVLHLIHYSECSVQEEAGAVKRAKLSFTFAILISFVACMTPTTKEYAAILILPAIANNENVQDVGQELVELAKEWLKEIGPTETK